MSSLIKLALLVGAGAVSLGACASDKDDPASVALLYLKQGQGEVREDLGVSQIGEGHQGSALGADQIEAGEAPLTVAQLRAYRDRCAPGAKELPPPELDCSELGLMIKRTFRSDDDIARAIATLDRLSTSQKGDLQSRLERGDLTALDAQAVAAGVIAIDPASTTTPEPESQIDLEKLEAAIGAIVIAPNQ